MTSLPATTDSKKSQASPAAGGYGYGYYAAPAPPAAGPPGAAADAAPPQGTLATYVEEFNRILKKMACELAIRYPSDASIDRAKKRILLAIHADPFSIIGAVGPYLFKYREGIYAGAADFFIENDYDAELKQSVNAEKADLASYIIPKVKTAWTESDADQREAYKATVQGLLDVYLEYLAVKHAQ